MRLVRSAVALPVMPAEDGIHVSLAARCRAMTGGYTYITTNGPSGTLYTGVTVLAIAGPRRLRAFSKVAP